MERKFFYMPSEIKQDFVTNENFDLQNVIDSVPVSRGSYS